MRRPLPFIAASFGVGIVTAHLIELTVVLSMMLVTVTGIIVIYSYLYSGNELIKRLFAFLCIFSLGTLWFLIGEMKENPLQTMEGSETEFTGVVEEVSYNENMYSLVVSNDETTVLVKYYSEEPFLTASYGKVIRVNGTVLLPQQRRNPNCFDYRLYLKSCGIHTMINAETVQLDDEVAEWHLAFVGMVRRDFEKSLMETSAKDNAGIIMAILFGDKSLLNEDLYEDFQRNGTAHVLAVSGLHTGILYAFFTLLWRWRKGTLFYLLTFTILLFYMALAEFSPSVVRASCMIILHLISLITKSRYDLLSAASFTFILMLLSNVYQIFHSGFQLSFLAIVSLAIIMPFVKYFYEGIFLSAVAIQFGMMPYTAYLFNYISIGSFVANIPVVFLAGIILPIGLVALICSFFLPSAFHFSIIVLDLGCDLLIWINSVFYMSDATTFNVTSPPIWTLIIYYGVLIFFMSETGQLLFLRKKLKVIAVWVSCVILIAIASIPVLKNPFLDAEIVFVDVGQGDCVHIKTPSGKNYLIDGGGSTEYDTGLKTVKPYLLKNGVKEIDAAFVTHLHEDHYGGIRSLAADGMINQIAVYEGNKLIENQIKRETHTDILYLHGGQTVKLDEEVFIEVISPESRTNEEYQEMILNEEDENDSSLIMKLIYKGKTVLMTGDIDEEGERHLIEKYTDKIDCDIMKVPHHGSKYGSSEMFIEKTSPLLAIFQVGRNNYGHPSPETLNRYQEYGSAINRNDKDGAIGIYVDDGEGIKVVTMIH